MTEDTSGSNVMTRNMSDADLDKLIERLTATVTKKRLQKKGENQATVENQRKTNNDKENTKVNDEPQATVSTEPLVRQLSNNWLDAYLEYAGDQESPPIFHRWVGVSLISAVLRRHVYIRQGKFKVYPTTYIILVAPSGRCRKTTAISMGGKFAHKLGNLRLLTGKTTPEGLLHFMREGGIEKVRSPETQRDIYRSECYAYMQSGELADFLNRKITYTAGIEELLTSLYDNEDIKDVNTKSEGHVILHKPCLNFIGASTPEWLEKSFDEASFAGGYMGRVIFVVQTREHRKVPWPSFTDEQRQLEGKLLNDLKCMATLTGDFKVTKEAKDYYAKWYINYTPDNVGRMAGYAERKPVHMLKLAMILSVADGNSLEINEEHIRKAQAMLYEVEQLMPQAFAFIGSTNEAKITNRIVDIIANSTEQPVPQKQLFRACKHMLRNKREFINLLDMLIEAGDIVRLIKRVPGESPQFMFRVTEEYENRTQQEVTFNTNKQKKGVVQ